MIAHVVAYDKNRLIGQNGTLPWHYKEDLQYFKALTQGKTVLMGRKTYQSILDRLQKPLPNRTNVVVSKTLVDDRVHVVRDLDAYLNTAQDDIYIIGGASIYEATLARADRLYITHIDAAYDGDTFYPAWNPDDFKSLESRISGPLRFAVYERTSHD